MRRYAAGPITFKLADGKTRDFICYEWMLGGKFLRSRHRVIGGADSLAAAGAALLAD